MQFSESFANILLRHADAMQIDPFCMTFPTVCHLLQWILRIWRNDEIRIPAPNRSTDFDPALPLMSAANAAKAVYNSLILLSGAPEGIRTPDLCLRRAILSNCRRLPQTARLQERSLAKRAAQQRDGRAAHSAFPFNDIGPCLIQSRLPQAIGICAVETQNS
jgi:hypothetical protein